MKAIELIDYLDRDSLKLKEAVIPSVKPGEILIKVHYAGVNPFDIKIVEGFHRDHIPLQFPFIPGGDFSGTVESVSPEVTSFKAGEEVYGTSNVLSGGSGSFAEFTVTGIETVVKKPFKATHEEAAGLVLAGVSAYQALYENIGLQNEQKILIHGAAGGIGHLAVQMAASIGAHISVTASREDFDFVKKLGATGLIDYKTQNFETLLREYDAVLDTVGGEITLKSADVLKSGGVLVSMAGELDEGLAKEKGIKFIKQNTKVTAERLQKLTELVDVGKIKVNIDKSFYLGDIAKAFEHMKKGSPKGKVVLKVMLF